MKLSRLAVLVMALAALPALAQLKLPSGGGAAAGSGALAPLGPPPAPAAPAAAAAADTSEMEAAGALAAAGWLVLLDRRDWGRAWETTAAMFRVSVPLGAWMDGVPKLRDPLGPMAERTPGEARYKTSLAGRPEGHYVTVAFDTRFDNQAVEELVTVVREADGRWRVTGYQTR